MPSVWDLVEAAIDDGRVTVPREVYREVVDQEDEISDLLKRHKDAVVEPSREVQIGAGQLEHQFPKPGLRDRADPFVMDEAEMREFAVVTYEGITFSGAPARGADKKLPALCGRLSISCTTLPQALRQLGLRL